MKTFAELGFPGRLIAVEGIDGSGKSRRSTAGAVARATPPEGVSQRVELVELVRAPPAAARRPPPHRHHFSLIHATDFADRYERQLLPLLRAGYLVLCDRYIFTAFARDVVRGCPAPGCAGLQLRRPPDLTFFLKAHLDTSLARILNGRVELKYFEAGMDLGLSSDPEESYRLFQDVCSTSIWP